MRKPGFLLPGLLFLAGLFGAPAQAQVTQPTSVLAAGGNAASGAGYTAQGTLGQPVAGQTAAASYANGIGFWVQVAGPTEAPPPGGTRYVAPTGNDAGNDCTNPATPCATITYAVGQANDGDTIDVAAGTYNEAGLVLDKNLRLQGPGVIVQ